MVSASILYYLHSDEYLTGKRSLPSFAMPHERCRPLWRLPSTGVWTARAGLLCRFIFVGRAGSLVIHFLSGVAALSCLPKGAAAYLCCPVSLLDIELRTLCHTVLLLRLEVPRPSSVRGDDLCREDRTDVRTMDWLAKKEKHAHERKGMAKPHINEGICLLRIWISGNRITCTHARLYYCVRLSATTGCPSGCVSARLSSLPLLPAPPLISLGSNIDSNEGGGDALFFRLCSYDR